MADVAVSVIENDDAVADACLGGPCAGHGRGAGQDVATGRSGDGETTGGRGRNAYYLPDAAVGITFQSLHSQCYSLRTWRGAADVYHSFAIAGTAATCDRGVDVSPVQQGGIDGEMCRHLLCGEFPAILAGVDLRLAQFGLVARHIGEDAGEGNRRERGRIELAK